MLAGLVIRKGRSRGVDTFAFQADEKLLELAMECNKRVNPDIQAFKGRVVSGDQFISDKDKKKWLIETFGASCTEMEGPQLPRRHILTGSRTW